MIRQPWPFSPRLWGDQVVEWLAQHQKIGNPGHGLIAIASDDRIRPTAGALRVISKREQRTPLPEPKA